MTTKATRVLFVCMGNTCRSPTAEAVFRHAVAQQGFEEVLDLVENAAKACSAI